MRSQHFHLACAALLAVTAIEALLTGQFAVSCFVGLGAIVALLHWKFV
jgi:hypothetical protein